MHDINESATSPDGNKYRANFVFLMTWNDGGGGGAYMSMDGNGFCWAMANTGYCRYDPPSGATPHEFGHVWEGTAAGFNGTDSSGMWWECTANWMMLQFLNAYPQAGGLIWNSMYLSVPWAGLLRRMGHLGGGQGRSALRWLLGEPGLVRRHA